MTYNINIKFNNHNDYIFIHSNTNRHSDSSTNLLI